MMTDHELLMQFTKQHREELRRSMERSRGFRPLDAARALRNPVRMVIRPLRPARREA